MLMIEQNIFFKTTFVFFAKYTLLAEKNAYTQKIVS